MTSPRLLIPEITENQASKYLTHNEAIRVVDALVQLTVQAQQNTPPVSPSEGQCWIVGTSPTGIWVGKSNQIAQYYNAAWYYHVPSTGWRAHNVATSLELFYTGSAWAGSTETQCIPIACSDETTALTAGTNKVTFRMPYAFVLTDIRASLTTAQTSGNIFTVDVNEAGVSILSTKLTIDNTEKTSVTAATARVISDTSLANDAEITIDIDQIGNGSATGLKVYLIGYRA